MKKNLPSAFFLTFLLYSCGDKMKQEESHYFFWAQDMQNNRYYQVDAELLAEGRYCKIWAEKGCGVSELTAQRTASAYDYEIYPIMMNTFGFDEFIMDGNAIRLNTMQVADAWLGDNDGKLCILLLDIKDSYSQGNNESYVAGYFHAGNFLDTNYSNKRDMIYLDTNPLTPGSKLANAVLAHEMQHLMNNVTSYVKRRNHQMDTWIDEGLSSAAEWLYAGHQEDRLDWYNQNGYGKGLIDRGNNFFVWGNRRNESDYAVMDDYATVYLFFQWLRIQADSPDIYKKIINSDYYDYRSVISAIGSSNWAELLETWHTDIYFNADSRGYNSDNDLKNIKAHTAPGGTRSLSLFPGEGVYSILPGNYLLPPDEGNIKYAVIDYASAPDVLLTYNVNTALTGRSEHGLITGVAAPEENPPFRGRYVTAPSAGPFRISAEDMLRRNGHEGAVLGSNAGQTKRFTVDE